MVGDNIKRKITILENDDELKMLKTFIKDFISKNFRFPTFFDTVNYTGILPEKVKNLMNQLHDSGYVSKIKNWYRLATKQERKQRENKPQIKQVILHEMESQKIPEIIPMIRTKKIIKPKIIKKKVIESEFGIQQYIIQGAMALIGLGACVISIYYTTIWLLEFLPFAFSLLLSGIMIGFSILAFETIILFISAQITKNKFSKLTIAILFLILWLIVSFFSVMSTVAGQYNKHVANLRIQVQQGIATGKEYWKILQTQKEELRQRLSEHREQITVLNKILSGMNNLKLRTENSQLWEETQWRLQTANNQMMMVSNELNKLREEELKQLEDSKKTGIILSSPDGKKEIPDFYGWMSNVLKIDRDKVQFWMSLFPAVFVDIIAPVSLAIALFMRKKIGKK